jgi:hypothetical protein
MKKVKLPAILLIILLLFLTCHSVALPANPKSLKGIKGIYVLIEELPESLKSKTGLTEDQLRTDVELKLRLAGISVVSESESLYIPGFPYLYVNINGYVEEIGLVVYNIEVELRQTVILKRNRSIEAVGATTWKTGTIGTVGLDKSSASIRNAVKDHVDGFINAYLSVNPVSAGKQPLQKQLTNKP